MRYIQREFVGRKDDLACLVDWLTDPAVKVICIIGEPGAGKTAVADRVYEHGGSSRFERRIRHFAFRAGKWEGLQDWLLLSMARELLPTVAPTVSRDELESSIHTYISEHSTLLFVDNAESLDQIWLLDFVNKWLGTASQSMLMLTTTQELSLSDGVVAGYKSYHLGGFSKEEEEAILSLIGEELEERFQRAQLLDGAARLRNNPQQLLYLRWLNPQNNMELDGVVDQLHGDEPIKNIGVIIKNRIDGPVTPFLALGHVRSLAIRESTLVWLWDRLIGGSIEAYQRVRDQLISEGFLSRTEEPSSDLMYVHPGVHIRLEKYLEHNIGLPNISHVDYYLSLYYRHEFERQSGTPDIALLYEYILHAIRARNLLGALGYVLATERLSRLHSMGLALGLSQSFLLLDDEIETQRDRVGKSSEEATKLVNYLVAVKTELAHCWCDLSGYDRCLAILDQAEQMLSELQDKRMLPSIRQNINYLRGISLGCLGRSSDSMRAYIRVVKDGIRGERIDRLAIEALGYVALNLSFQDMHRAQILGRKALTLADEQGESILVAKNKCSVAQILFFAGKIEEADKLFDEAENLCRPVRKRIGDRRELARVLVARSMVSIANAEYDEAVEMLVEAENIHSLAGERRRLGRAKLLEGICLWHNRHAEEGMALVEQAIREHYQIGDWLSLVLEALTYGLMLGFGNTTQSIRNAQLPQHRDQAWAKILTDPVDQGSFELYKGYWESYFRPRLLG